MSDRRSRHRPRAPRKTLGIALLLALAGCAAGATPPLPHNGRAQLPLFDFDTAAQLDRVAELRDTCPYPTRGAARFTALDADGGGALRVDYALAAADPTPVGVRFALDGVDASSFDHLQLRLRRGSAGELTLRVGFRRPEPGGRGLIQSGSFLLRHIAATWETHTLALHSMTGIEHWTDLSQIFVAVEPEAGAAQRGWFAVDDIVLLRTGDPGPAADTRPATPRKRAWIAAAEAGPGLLAAKRARLVGWPRRLLLPRAELPDDDTGLLRRLASDTWRGLDALRDRASGLPLDTISLRDAAADPLASRPPQPRDPDRDGAAAVGAVAIGDYTNVTNVGLYLLAVVAAHELELIDRTAAVARVEQILTTLEQLETYSGFFFNYYDTTSLERTTSFVSFIDSAWLSAGLITVRSVFAEVTARASALLGRGDFGFFYDATRGLMRHGFFTQLGVSSEYHYGLLYTEARIGSLIAIGKGDVPAEHWQRLARVFPAACAWQTQTPRNGTYQWRGRRYVPSWGGSMFEALMPTLVVDEGRWAPHGLGANDVAHATVQRRWAEEIARSPVWGASPSRSPAGGYREYGVAVLGVRGYPGGAVTPHAAALALAATPRAAVADLRRLIERYDLYGDFGLYDAVDPQSGRVAHDYLALDQAMLLVALANYLKPHSVQELFAADPVVQHVLPLLAKQRFFD